MASLSGTECKPFINVTPLIDVLLVLLIIFMVAAPLRPHSFSTKVPSHPENRIPLPHIDSLVVIIRADGTLQLNGLSDYMGTAEDPSKLSSVLVLLFKERQKNHAYRAEMLSRADLPDYYRIEKTVFIRAPRAIPYGTVAKVIDELKGAGADPVGLQLDGLN